MRRQRTAHVVITPGPAAAGYDPAGMRPDDDLTDFLPRVPAGHVRSDLRAGRTVSLDTRQVMAAVSVLDKPAHGEAPAEPGFFVPWPRREGIAPDAVRRAVAVTLPLPPEVAALRRDPAEEEVRDYLPPVPVKPGLYLGGITIDRETNTLTYTVVEAYLGQTGTN